MSWKTGKFEISAMLYLMCEVFFFASLFFFFNPLRHWTNRTHNLSFILCDTGCLAISLISYPSLSGFYLMQERGMDPADLISFLLELSFHVTGEVWVIYFCTILFLRILLFWVEVYGILIFSFLLEPSGLISVSQISDLLHW